MTYKYLRNGLPLLRVKSQNLWLALTGTYIIPQDKHWLCLIQAVVTYPQHALSYTRDSPLAEAVTVFTPYAGQTVYYL